MKFNKTVCHKFIKNLMKQLQLRRKITIGGDIQITGGNEIGINRHQEKIKGKIIIDVKTKVHSEQERKHVGRSLNTHTRW